VIECVFTIDYEIFGNGRGALRQLVLEPTEELMRVFAQANAPFVAFVEVAELEMIAAHGTDEAIGAVENQVRRLRAQRHEVALHLHPQWYNARRQGDLWELDYTEYNLCTLPNPRIREIIDRALAYLRRLLSEPDFTPMSFRAGNWLFQPTKPVADVLVTSGIRIDSSVFKGGRQRSYGLDYRPARANSYYWTFCEDVNLATPGPLLEIPIFTEQVPFWKMLKTKRIALQQKAHPTPGSRNSRANRWLDFLRLRYPRKFDFCRMTFRELTGVVERVLQEDRLTPDTYKPLVAIGHSKDLNDLDTVVHFLRWLRTNGIPVTTLQEAAARCQGLSTAISESKGLSEGHAVVPVSDIRQARARRKA